MNIENCVAEMLAFADTASPKTWGAAIYPVALPQNPPSPALTYQMITGPRDYTQDGPDGVTTFRVQVDIWGGGADGWTEVRAVRDAFVTNLSGLHNVTFAGILMQGCFIDNERDNVDGEVEPSTRRLYRKTIDLMVTACHG